MRNILSLIGWSIIRLVSSTLRIRAVNAPDERHVVYAFWHGEQFIPFSYHSGQGVVVMSSLSKDGAIQAGIMQKLGYQPVRGSSSRGGDRALVEMIHRVKKGAAAAFAVDGPRGPFHKIKPGAGFLALKTGTRIVPLSSCARRYKIFSRAWDKYELPLPFSRTVIAYGQPVRLTSKERLDEELRSLEDVMEKLTKFTHRAYWGDDVASYLASHPRPRILIIQPSRIGDVVFSLPTLAALRKKYPHAWIGWLVDERCASVIEGNPLIDEVIVIDRSKLSLSSIMALRSRLRKMSLDVTIDLHGLFKSAVWAAMAGARFRIASSSTNGMRELSWLFSKEIAPETPDTHCVERHLAVARYLGCVVTEPEYTMAVSAAARETVERLLAGNGITSSKPIIVIHPGGGWIARRWFSERFARLISRAVNELGAQVVLVGGKEGGATEEGLNEEIISAAGAAVTDFTGRLSIKDLAALLLKADVFIANEAGPMHIATALKIPSIAILGPTDPRRTGPFGGRTRVIRRAVDCQPCRNRDCTSRKCMEGITVDEVFEAAKEMLSSRGQTA